jgi:DNA-binding transcriptional LysR family regulator
MRLTRFAISAEEAELLMFFEETHDIRLIGKKLGRDPSGVSRAIKRLAEKFPVIEKISGRWQVTSLGTELNVLNRNFLQAQSSILQKQTTLRIGANREFAARVVAPRIDELAEIFRGTRIDLLSFEAGVEQPLKSGLIDIGFDCGRPSDPLLSYKLLVAEPIAPYCSKKFYKSRQTDIEAGKWSTLPHILCDRLYPDRIMNLSERSMKIAIHVNDIASARALAQAHKGWALLPNYSVAQEVESGTLIKMGRVDFDLEKYGIWWLRDRKYLQPKISSLARWMKNIEL